MSTGPDDAPWTRWRTLDQMAHLGPDGAPWTRWRSLDQMENLGPDGAPWTRWHTLDHMANHGPDGAPWTMQMAFYSVTVDINCAYLAAVISQGLVYTKSLFLCKHSLSIVERQQHIYPKFFTDTGVLRLVSGLLYMHSKFLVTVPEPKVGIY